MIEVGPAQDESGKRKEEDNRGWGIKEDKIGLSDQTFAGSCAFQQAYRRWRKRHETMEGKNYKCRYTSIGFKGYESASNGL